MFFKTLKQIFFPNKMFCSKVVLKSVKKMQKGDSFSIHFYTIDLDDNGREMPLFFAFHGYRSFTHLCDFSMFWIISTLSILSSNGQKLYVCNVRITLKMVRTIWLELGRILYFVLKIPLGLVSRQRNLRLQVQFISYQKFFLNTSS